MRTKRWLHIGATVLVLGLMAGCGSTGVSTDAAQPEHASTAGMPSGRHTMPDGTVMGGDQKASTARPPTAKSSDHPKSSRPSDAAAMVCSDEIASTVQSTLNLPQPPHRAATWSTPTFRCNYGWPGGSLSLTVADLNGDTGRAWFDRLRKRLGHATTINGLQNLGFPAFQTTQGDVAFLKDHKTLWVDATKIDSSQLPAKFNRTDVAYHLASAVLACWSE